MGLVLHGSDLHSENTVYSDPQSQAGPLHPPPEKAQGSQVPRKSDGVTLWALSLASNDY